MEQLDRSTKNCFRKRIKDYPVKKEELHKSLLFALQCVNKEMGRQLEHEKVYGFGKAKKNLSLLKREPPTSKQMIEWNEAMAKAQVSEAVRLTDEAFSKVNEM